MMEIKVDNQVAAPAETRNNQLAPSDKTSLTKSADGRVATVATRRGEKPCPIKKKMNPLDSDRPSHGRWQHRLKRETPNWHRAIKHRSPRVRMEGWRQWRL